MNDGNESAFTVNYSTPTAIRMSLISASRVKSALRPAERMSRPVWNFGDGHRLVGYAATSFFVA
jgi:hypothetical protein